MDLEEELLRQDTPTFDPAQSEFDLTSILASNQITAAADFDVPPSEDIHTDIGAKGPIYSTI